MDTAAKNLLAAFDQGGVVALADRQGNYTYVNSRWELETGIPAEEAVGKNVEDIVSGSGAMLALRTGRTVCGEMFLRSRAGREIASVMKYQPVFDAEKNVVGCLITSMFSGFEEAREFAERISAVLEKDGRGGPPARSASGAKYGVEDIIGDSAGMRDVKELIYIAGASSASCLIEGETGTGKELVAHAVHNVSERKIFPFIKVNCSAIPENLMESEFFGYEEGSFTGGVKGGKAGKFENAHRGSMFLDEINAMSLQMQPKLLRALQEKEIERVGGAKSIPVDVRVLAASNMPLDHLIEQGDFRRDLYYRLNIITIKIPPLRDRREDIVPLVHSFIARYNEEMRREVSAVSEEALAYLMEYDWPGNVRELQNAVERAMAASRGEKLELAHFRRFDDGRSVFRSDTPYRPARRGEAENGGAVRSLSQQKAESEKEAILRALEASGRNKSKAARMLNISRTMLYKKLEKYEIG